MQRNCAAYLKLRNWQWWRLFIKVSEAAPAPVPVPVPVPALCGREALFPRAVNWSQSVRL